MKTWTCTPFTANSLIKMVGGFVAILVGSGSDKRYEPVAITGEVGDWTITYLTGDGRSHKIGWNWTLYVVYE